MIKLFIDTTKREQILLKLDEKTFIKKSKKGSQAVLPFLTKVLKKEKLKLGDIKDVEVAPGPGSFTGIRIGVSIAKALAFSLGIKVNGVDPEEVLEINY